MARWYLTWKEIFPDSLVKEPIITHYFSEALDMMAVSLSHATAADMPRVKDMAAVKRFIIPPALTLGNDYFSLVHKRKRHNIAMRKLETLERSASYSSGRHGNGSNTSFKDVVEAFALSNDMTFLPKRTGNGTVLTSDDGLPLWVFNDRVTCYIDQNVLYAKVEVNKVVTWKPMVLDSLLNMAR